MLEMLNDRLVVNRFPLLSKPRFFFFAAAAVNISVRNKQFKGGVGGGRSRYGKRDTIVDAHRTAIGEFTCRAESISFQLDTSARAGFNIPHDEKRVERTTLTLCDAAIPSLKNKYGPFFSIK